MKIVTKLGVITLLVPMITFNNCKLQASLISKEVNDDNISIEFSSLKDIHYPNWFNSSLKISIDNVDLREFNKFRQKEYILHDTFIQDIFEVHSTDFMISPTLKDEFDAVINSSIKGFSFYVTSIDKKISFGYNPDQKYSCASSIKGPYSLFCYKQLEKGVSSLDEVINYGNEFYSTGTGIMQNVSQKSYTIRDILYNTIHYSDNIGYGMLYNHFGVEEYNLMIESLGCNYLKLTPYSKWGFASPREMVLVWQEIYNYKDTEYGRIFFDDLSNAKYNFIKNSLPNKDIAHKSGYSIRGYNDHGIVFDTITPYIISIMLPYPDETDNHKEVLSKIVKLSDKVIEEYNIYLENNKAKELTK